MLKSKFLFTSIMFIIHKLVWIILLVFFLSIESHILHVSKAKWKHDVIYFHDLNKLMQNVHYCCDKVWAIAFKTTTCNVHLSFQGQG